MKQILALSHARKAYDGKVVLDDVTLAFLPGAKVGVVGPNGMGKSTLLRMMAGLEQPSNGEARLMPGYTAGILLQEPSLNEDKTVLGNVEEGVAATQALIERYNHVAAQMATDYTDELLAEMGRLLEQLDHRGAWDLDSRLEQAMDALRCPPPDAEVSVLSGGERRRVALCRLLLSQPDLLLLDEPTNHLDAESVAWLEHHPRPVLPGQRGRLDPRAGPRPGLPLRGELLHVPGDQGVPAQGRGAAGRQAAQAAGGRAGMGAVQPAGTPGEEPRPAGAV
jgi:ATPase subunit of ABC transporter with duplicated ATPase domains